ncbi:MAG: M43 family zinc metalloprotease [Bacteroidia bacterium]
MMRYLWMGLVWAQPVCPTTKAFFQARGPWPTFVPTLKTAQEDTFYIPLVFHILHQEGNENISDAQLYSAVDALNRDFQPAKIQFFLTRTDPQGRPHCGINRIFTPLTDHDLDNDTALKELIQWNTLFFCNIWVVKSIAGNILGYAIAMGLPGEGIVMAHKYVGTLGTVRRPYHLGRTFTHEMGHYLNLLHPFEGGCKGTNPQTCDTQGDYICDTPPQKNPIYGCHTPGSINSCQETPIDLPDPLENYMGYQDDSCMKEFTPQQISRMRYALPYTQLTSPENLQARGWKTPAFSCQAAYLSLPPYPRLLTPNPDQIQWQGTPPLQLKIYNSLGNLLCDCAKPCEISTSTWESGIYYVQILQGNTLLETYKLWKW